MNNLILIVTALILSSFGLVYIVELVSGFFYRRRFKEFENWVKDFSYQAKKTAKELAELNEVLIKVREKGRLKTNPEIDIIYTENADKKE